MRRVRWRERLKRRAMAQVLRDLKAKVTPLALRVVEEIFPPRCMACSGLTQQAHLLCSSCFTHAEWISPPWCARCGLPFDVAMGEDALCGACIESEPSFAGARAALRYGEVARQLAGGLKFRDRADLAIGL